MWRGPAHSRGPTHTPIPAPDVCFSHLVQFRWFQTWFHRIKTEFEMMKERKLAPGWVGVRIRVRIRVWVNPVSLMSPPCFPALTEAATAETGPKRRQKISTCRLTGDWLVSELTKPESPVPFISVIQQQEVAGCSFPGRQENPSAIATGANHSPESRHSNSSSSDREPASGPGGDQHQRAPLSRFWRRSLKVWVEIQSSSLNPSSP